MQRMKAIVALLAVAGTVIFMIADSEARVRSGGSRGTRTFAAPPVTQTAPTAAAPIQRSVTQPGTAANRPVAAGAASQGTRPGLFGGLGGGLLGGLAAGFLGAGLFGLLTGSGFLAGMGGFASFLGLLLQIGLIVVVARLLFLWWQRRSQPAPLAAYAGRAPANLLRRDDAHNFDRAGGPSGFGGGSAGDEPVEIGKSDYDAFEKLLGEIQTAYSNEDLAALRGLATPEMVSYMADDLAGNASRGVVNRMTDVKLLQGDLAEAWREGDAEYATVAMRFSLVDRMIERAGGRTVEGGAAPQEATELWTFRRSRGGNWMLSAIQNT